jgi:hypothetical protein
MDLSVRLHLQLMGPVVRTPVKRARLCGHPLSALACIFSCAGGIFCNSGRKLSFACACLVYGFGDAQLTLQQNIERSLSDNEYLNQPRVSGHAYASILRIYAFGCHEGVAHTHTIIHWSYMRRGCTTFGMYQ